MALFSPLRLSKPGSTGMARNDVSGWMFRVNTGVPAGVISVINGFAPQEITQSPPGSSRALPQHDEDVTRGSVICSNSVAVRLRLSTRKRKARGGRSRLV